MLNPFFLNGSKSEQGLMQDLINESLRMYGVDVYYIPRQYVTEKTVIQEVIESKFTTAFPIEAYVQTYDGYSGQGTLLSKFGIQELDDLTIVISKERYQNYIAPIAKNIEDAKLTKRPKEGDLIYFPLGRRIFEIKYVEHEKPFYQLQKNYVYELTCELFRYEDEIIDTGLNFIDNPYSEEPDGSGDTYDNRDLENAIDPNDPLVYPPLVFGYSQSLQMVGVGTTATATCDIVDGGVRYVTITNRGSGYTDVPIVAFSSAPYGGTTAVGVATMISGIIDLCNTNSSAQRVQGIEIVNTGYGYTTVPMLSFTGGGGSGTEAVAVIGDGIVNDITITNEGSGYIQPPTVTFVGICSVTAKANAVLNSAGYIEDIRITDAGLGYTTAPSILISAPEIMVGFGTYIFNETVTGTDSQVKAIVKNWNSTNKILTISNITGDFNRGETIIGEKSGAYYILNYINIEANSGNLLADKFDQNNTIQEEANKILDFSEGNPFGTP